MSVGGGREGIVVVFVVAVILKWDVVVLILVEFFSVLAFEFLVISCVGMTFSY